MTATITSAYIDQFSADLHQLVEQKASKLRPTVKVEMAKGEKHFFDRLGIFSANERTARNAPVVIQDAAHSRRMANVKVYDAAATLDTIDSLKMLIDPTSDYAMKLARAHAKNLDDVIIAALYEDAATGRDGAGTQSATAATDLGDDMDVAAFNVLLLAAEAAEIDMDGTRMYLALGAKGVADLLNDTSNHITSFDYQNEKALAGANLPNFRGVNIVRTQRLPEYDASHYRAFLYTEDAIQVAMAKDITVKINERVDLQGHPVQVYTESAFGAVRMEELLVHAGYYNKT